jgi:hypothetical protein
LKAINIANNKGRRLKIEKALSVVMLANPHGLILFPI